MTRARRGGRIFAAAAASTIIVLGCSSENVGAQSNRSSSTVVPTSAAASAASLSSSPRPAVPLVHADKAYSEDKADVSLASAKIVTYGNPVRDDQPGWSGNYALNPGFEEDFVNVEGEGHVLSFKGDWYYNQSDMYPDYWKFTDDSPSRPQPRTNIALVDGKVVTHWSWTKGSPHSGKRSLRLESGSVASQSFHRAMYHWGGSAWNPGSVVKIPVSEQELPNFNQPWRASVWVRGGGSIKLGSVTATAAPGNDWQLLTVELPADKVGDPSGAVGVSLIGPGEFDDLIVQEKFSDAPNLAKNISFEEVDKNGYPAGWSQQQKFNAIGPTYYVWTDWNHAFAENRGQVTADELVSHSGSRSLRLDVYPGDEKFIESDLITLNQTTPKVIEVGLWVRADQIKLIDVRCVDEDGLYMPGYRPSQPEYRGGGSHTFGTGTFGWRYVRKFFGTPQGRPVKGVRVRLAARGFNGHTLDDFGDRAQLLTSGTVWWDDIRVTERVTDEADLARRGVSIPKQTAVPAGKLADAEVDLGQRRLGQNALTYTFTNNDGNAAYQLRVTTKLPDGEAVTTESPSINVNKGQRGELVAPYLLDRLAPDLQQQGTFKVELLRGGKVQAEETYAFNTWTKVVDIDVSRAYSLPNENPVTVAFNLNASDATLAKVKKVEAQLVRIEDGNVLGTTTWNDLNKAFSDTLANLPKPWEKGKYGSQGPAGPEFNLVTPEWTVDRTNLIVYKQDLSKLKVWPHDYPVRDTKLVIRALDGSGKVLFEEHSDGFGRMQAEPDQKPIQTVEVREDGAVLINGEPRFLTGATHQHFRLAHTPPMMKQLGLMGHRLNQGMSYEETAEMWDKYKLYALQMKPHKAFGGTVPVVDMNPEQKADFEAWVKGGGMKNVVSINTGGWEATINTSNPDQVAKHAAINDYIRKVSGRPTAISTSGAYNAYWIPNLVWYDINHAETEMWGPMDFNVIWTPYMKRARKEPSTWVYLPQLYDNHPYERYRFETYDNIIRGSAGVSMIQGIGDPTFNRGLAGELRYLEKPLYSLDKAPDVTIQPNGLNHKVSSYQGKTYVLATNGGAIATGKWKWNTDNKQSGSASHEGDSWNQQWFRPDGISVHGFRGMPMPELIQKGDVIVQYVWIDPANKPDWISLAVRGDGKFIHNVTLGDFNFANFKAARGNLLMYSELNHSVWHEVNWVMDDETYDRAVRVMGKDWADNIKKHADSGRANVDSKVYQAEHFRNLRALPKAGEWVRIEFPAEKVDLVGHLVDGFAYMHRNGRVLWDYTALERNGEVVRVFSDDAVGIPREQLDAVRVNVPGLKAGTKVKVLFEGRDIVAEDGYFIDNMQGVDTYGFEAYGPEGDMFGFVRDEDRELARMMPSGHGYNYGPTAVRVYEIPK